MKIGYFTSRFPYPQQSDSINYPIGGSVSATYSLACEMAKKGHEISVFTSSWNYRDSVEKKDNLIIYRYGTLHNFFSSNFSPGLFYKTFKHKLDIVHTSFDIPPSPIAGYLYSKKMNVPLILTYHADMLPYGNQIRKSAIDLFNKLFVERILTKSDVIISPSKSYVESSKFLKKYPEKIVVIPNGIDLSKYQTPLSKIESRQKLGLSPDKNIILFCGFLSQHKGPDIALKAFYEVITKEKNSELIFLGDGIMKNELIVMSKKFNIEKSVKFVGFIEDIDTKLHFFNSADIFILPSLTESFGLVNLEAMAYGLPIIASKVGGIPDIVKHNENGLLVKPNSVVDLREAIFDLFNSDEKRRRMGITGKVMANNYSWINITEKTENLYFNLL
jgi:glycosyltransferase involved in cell wall biosynthesis